MWIAREAEIREEGRVEGEAKGRAEGRAEGEAKGHEETTYTLVKALMEKLNIPAEKAMELLGVSKEDLPDHKTI